MKPITVIDSLMGSGKTEWAIKYMNTHLRKRFLYISPFKKQDERIKERCRSFYVPPDDQGKKLELVKLQIKKKRNIASTHALFQLFDDECVMLIKKAGYTLILDEVLEIINPLKFNKSDIQLLTQAGIISTDDDHRVIWNDKFSGLSLSTYGELEDLAKKHSIVNVCDETLVWQFPPEIFAAFKDVYVLTYYFESNIMHPYFLANNLKYIKKSIKDGELVDFYKPDLSKYKDLINIYEGKLNTNIKQDRTAFSLSWYNNPENEICINRMKKNIYNWYKNISKSKSQDRMWTSFNDHRGLIQDKGYMKNYVVNNCRSTNEYMDRYSLVYTINRFYNPMLIKHFSSIGHPLNQDLFALSEMIQWIWRSRIRKDEPIDIYIPSDRMRGLLHDWIDGKI